MKLKAFKHVEREYCGMFNVKVWEETFKEYFNRKIKKINNDIENYNLPKANSCLSELKKDTRKTFYRRGVASIVGGSLGFYAYILGTILYTRYKAGSSQELADRLREYASSQGFDDYHKFVDDVNANVTTRTTGGLFNKSTEYFYSSPEYQNWFSNIEIIKDDVYHNVQESVEQTFICSWAIVGVIALCCSPFVVSHLKERHYIKIIEKMEQELNLNDKVKEKGLKYRLQPTKDERAMRAAEKTLFKEEREHTQTVGGFDNEEEHER